MMRIVRRVPERMTIEEFAEKHDLVMEVVRRKGGNYYAHFQRAEVKDGSILIGTSGEGLTEDEAISNYATEISDKLLVIGAYTKERREIWAPQLDGRAA